MRISIIIPTVNLKDKLEQCLTSLETYTNMNEVQVVIADNGSTDGTFEMVMERHYRPGKDVYLRFARNLNYAPATNIGVIAADSEALLFLNNDVYISEEGWLDDMLSALYEGATIVGHKLLYLDGSIQHAGIIPNPQGIPIHALRGSTVALTGKESFIGVTFACALMTTKDFMLFGGLDARFINGFEDMDLCMKVISKGREIVCCMDKTIYHHECSTPGRHIHEDANLRLYVSRWCGVSDGGERTI